MSKSIMSNEAESYLPPHKTCELERHHIYFGNPNRKLSERWGCWCYLTAEEHQGDRGPHHCRKMDLKLKKECQKKFEELYGREKFMQVFGRNYL